MLFVVATLNIGFSTVLNAYVMVCDNGDCVTTIHTYSGGFNWSVLCDDGAHASGSSTGEYVGSCE